MHYKNQINKYDENIAQNIQQFTDTYGEFGACKVCGQWCNLPKARCPPVPSYPPEIAEHFLWRWSDHSR